LGTPYLERVKEREERNLVRDAQLVFLRDFLRHMQPGKCPTFEAELKTALSPYFSDDNLKPLIASKTTLDIRLNELVKEGLLLGDWNGFRWVWTVR
jgi:hypothetical protein